MFSFKDLCEQMYGPSDYIELGNNHHHHLHHNQDHHYYHYPHQHYDYHPYLINHHHYNIIITMLIIISTIVIIIIIIIILSYLGHLFNTIFISDIPKMSISRHRNELRRFITLIDALYEQKGKKDVYCSSCYNLPCSISSHSLSSSNLFLYIFIVMIIVYHDQHHNYTS